MGLESTTPAGIGDGPLFVVVIVYVVDVPAATVATPSVFVSARSPWMMTASVSVPELSEGSVSAIDVCRDGRRVDERGRPVVGRNVQLQVVRDQQYDG